MFGKVLVLAIPIWQHVGLYAADLPKRRLFKVSGAGLDTVSSGLPYPVNSVRSKAGPKGAEGIRMRHT